MGGVLNLTELRTAALQDQYDAKEVNVRGSFDEAEIM